MNVGFLKSIKGEEEIPQVVFDDRTITDMPGLFPVITCSRVFYKRPIHVLFAAFGQSKTIQKPAQAIMERPFERVAGCLFNLWCKRGVKSERIGVSTGA